MVSDYEPFEIRLGRIIMGLSILIIIFDIFLFFPTLQVKKAIPNWTFVLCQFLVSSIIAATYFLLNEIQRQYKKIGCTIILILRNYCSLIIISSSLCICLSSLFILTNNYVVKQRPLLMKIIFILITWFPSLIILSVIFIGDLKDNIQNQNDCVIENPNYIIIYYSVISFYYVAIFAMCARILYKLIKINSLIQNDMSKKSFKVIRSYLIGILLFFACDITCDILRTHGSTIAFKIRSVFLIFLCFMNPVMIYLFVLNKQVKKNVRLIYCSCCLQGSRTHSNVLEGMTSQEEDEID